MAKDFVRKYRNTCDPILTSKEVDDVGVQCRRLLLIIFRCIDTFLRVLSLFLILKFLRQKFMLVYLTCMLKDQPFIGDFETRKTNMHGTRLVFKNENELTKLIEQNSNLPSIDNTPAITFKIQSESDYASIFFVQWPVNKLSLFSENE